VRILIAEDDRTSRLLLERALAKWGHEVVVTENGADALRGLLSTDAPRLAILDWMMPDLDGVEVCSRVRRANLEHTCYVILLTARKQKADIVEGLEAGANDYVTKPFDLGELRARVRVGQRVVELESALRQRVRDLEEAREHIEMLHGILPICSSCRKIRDDDGFWQRVDVYFQEHSDLEFSHGLCPECRDTLYPELAAKMAARRSGRKS
jgi:DNA-binding response OmpR family regulator